MNHHTRFPQGARTLRLAATVVFAATAGLSHAKDAIGFEAAPALPGTTFAKEAQLKGPLHKVGEPVRVEGHLDRFVIESKFGKFSVHGATLMATRVHEMQAIEELQKSVAAN